MTLSERTAQVIAIAAFSGAVRQLAQLHGHPPGGLRPRAARGTPTPPNRRLASLLSPAHGTHHDFFGLRPDRALSAQEGAAKPWGVDQGSGW